MSLALDARQQELQAELRAFAAAEVAPHAARFDREERVDPELIALLARNGYLGALAPEAHGGAGMDMVSFGLLNEEIGRACSSVRSLLTVHSMVITALLRWGTAAQQERWLPALASGRAIGAFALSEPAVGSDARSVEARAELRGDAFHVTGVKKWITFGQIADLFLLFAQQDGKPLALLVERNTPGLTVTPITGMLGTRGSMLAEVRLAGCEVPRANQVGRAGFGFTAVITSALDIGRYSVASGCVGIGQACLDATVAYSGSRRQFGEYLKDHQLIREMVTNMLTEVRAARLLCLQAGYAKGQGAPDATTDILIAKYYASRMANRVASDAVQIHGANGCSADFPVARYLRDAKVMEIIEGSSQIQQLLIAKAAYQH